MKLTKTSVIWIQGMTGQFIEGAADAFIIVMGGSTASAVISKSPVLPMTVNQVGTSILLGGLLYLATFLKKNPLPTIEVKRIDVEKREPS